MNAKLQEIRSADETDAFLDRIIEGKEDIDQVSEKMFRHGAAGPQVPAKLSQPENIATDADLYAQAKESQDEFSELLNKLGTQFNAEIKNRPGGALKEFTKIKPKADADYSGDVRRVRDVNAGTLVFETVDDIYSAIRGTQAEGIEVGYIDKFEDVPDDGYRDINLNVRLHNGHVAEIQLHERKFLEAKDDLGHHIYALVKELQRNGEGVGFNQVAIDDTAVTLRAISKKFYDLVHESKDYSSAKASASFSEIVRNLAKIVDALSGSVIWRDAPPGPIAKTLSVLRSYLNGIPSYSKNLKSSSIAQPPDAHNITPDAGKVNEDQTSIIKRINDSLGEKGSVDLGPLVDLGRSTG